MLLGAAPRGVTDGEMRATIARVTAWARDRDIRLGRELAGGDPAALCATIDTLVASGLLTRFEAGSETIYSIDPAKHRSEEHTSDLQSLVRISYAVFCLKKKKIYN